MLQQGLPLTEAIKNYSLLTIGDGLVTQIPALLLSVATGLIVTRSTTKGGMGEDIVKQFGAQRHALRMGGAFVLALCVIPGLPKLPFLLVGGAILLMAQRLPTVSEEEQAEADAVETAAAPNPDSPEQLAEAMRIDPIELELAADLLDLVDRPPVATCSSGSAPCAARWRWSSAWSCRRSAPATTSTCRCRRTSCASTASRPRAARRRPGACSPSATPSTACPGRATVEPVFGLPAKWVPAELRHHAEVSGATVVDRASVLTTHLAEMVRVNASRAARPRGRPVPWSR